MEKPQRHVFQCFPSWQGKSVVTVEGLSEREKEVYAYAFAKVGAVQCGFCIPGMVMCAKGLLDQNPDPSRVEAAATIRNNICRCTGYQKIIEAILLLSKDVSGRSSGQENSGVVSVGAPILRVDAKEKVLGTGQYPDDVYLDDMIYASAVRSEYPRSKSSVAIHTEKVLEVRRCDRSIYGG